MEILITQPPKKECYLFKVNDQEGRELIAVRADGVIRVKGEETEDGELIKATLKEAAKMCFDKENNLWQNIKKNQ